MKDIRTIIITGRIIVLHQCREVKQIIIEHLEIILVFRTHAYASRVRNEKNYGSKKEKGSKEKGSPKEKSSKEKKEIACLQNRPLMRAVLFCVRIPILADYGPIFT